MVATATALGVGGVLLPGASAMAATTPTQTTTVVPVSQSTSLQPRGENDEYYYCEWDEYGNWACVWW
jgi:nitrous oxide reductase